MTADGADTVAAEARDHPALEWGARIGFAVYGVVYVVLGWLAVQVAVGSGHHAGSASGQGALQELAQQPLGGAVLWIAFAGFCALVLWEAATALAGHHDQQGAKRVFGRLGSAMRAVVFVAFAVITAEVALGSAKGGGAHSWTARLMQLPAGPLIVGAIGLVIAGYGGFSVYQGLGDQWRQELEPEGRTGTRGTAISVLARTGYTCRGVAFGIIGGLFVWAAFTEDPRHSGGLDQALLRLRGAPFGGALLVLIAVGFACFGIFNIAKVWHLRNV